MPTRSRASSKAGKGTAGKTKVSQRKSPATKARTTTSGRVKGARGGPATREHPTSAPTKRASSRRRTAEAGETLSNKRAKALRGQDKLADADVARIPGMRRARMRKEGRESS
jgi:hypothetical protein